MFFLVFFSLFIRLPFHVAWHFYTSHEHFALDKLSAFRCSVRAVSRWPSDHTTIDNSIQLRSNDLSDHSEKNHTIHRIKTLSRLFILIHSEEYRAQTDDSPLDDTWFSANKIFLTQEEKKLYSKSPRFSTCPKKISILYQECIFLLQKEICLVSRIFFQKEFLLE